MADLPNTFYRDRAPTPPPTRLVRVTPLDITDSRFARLTEDYLNSEACRPMMLEAIRVAGDATAHAMAYGHSVDVTEAGGWYCKECRTALKAVDGR